MTYIVTYNNGSYYLTNEEKTEIINEITEPTVLFIYDQEKPIDKQSICLSRFGNKSEIQTIYDKRYSDLQKAGLTGMFDYFMADLPLDIHVLNQVLENPNYLKTILGLR